MIFFENFADIKFTRVQIVVSLATGPIGFVYFQLRMISNCSLLLLICFSQVLICCVTKDFCESIMCQREVTLADRREKRIIPLLFESIEPWPPEGQLGLILGPLVYINMSQSTPSDFPEDKLQELFRKVGEFLERWNQRAFVHFWTLNILRALK